MSMKKLFDAEEAICTREDEVREEGEQSGIEKGIRAMVEVLKGVSQTEESIIKIIADKFNLQPQIAAEKVSLYWK